ncbi:MAG: hypothetical protein NZZ41_04420 [Candidatus Dojkabacteria bacterium]|nr:hypothetical protein [Candidatus Dojkabacteria bacterium]
MKNKKIILVTILSLTILIITPITLSLILSNTSIENKIVINNFDNSQNQEITNTSERIFFQIENNRSIAIAKKKVNIPNDFYVNLLYKNGTDSILYCNKPNDFYNCTIAEIIKTTKYDDKSTTHTTYYISSPVNVSLNMPDNSYLIEEEVDISSKNIKNPINKIKILKVNIYTYNDNSNNSSIVNNQPINTLNYQAYGCFEDICISSSTFDFHDKDNNVKQLEEFISFISEVTIN